MDPIAKAMSAQGGDLEEIAKLLYGDGAWEFISKKKMDEESKNRTQARIGLATNALGIAAGTEALVGATRKYRAAGKVPSKALTPFKEPKAPSGLGRAFSRVGEFGAKHPKALAGAAVGLQAANLAGDAVANRVLARNAKKKTGVAKRQLAPIENGEVTKSVDIETTFEISKVDTDKRQVFGWASVITMDGKPVVDLQDDYMAMETIEKAAYDYVKSSRKGGDMHDRDGEGPRHVSDMIESFVVTDEKKEKLGLPADFPTGWLVGFQVNDDDTWKLVKDGKRTQFSIHGSGQRVEKVLDE